MIFTKEEAESLTPGTRVLMFDGKELTIKDKYRGAQKGIFYYSVSYRTVENDYPLAFVYIDTEGFYNNHVVEVLSMPDQQSQEPTKKMRPRVNDCVELPSDNPLRRHSGRSTSRVISLCYGGFVIEREGKPTFISYNDEYRVVGEYKKRLFWYKYRPLSKDRVEGIELDQWVEEQTKTLNDYIDDAKTFLNLK